MNRCKKLAHWIGVMPPTAHAMDDGQQCLRVHVVSPEHGVRLERACRWRELKASCA